MNTIMHMPWIGRDLKVINSRDPTYDGRRGIIIEETQRTLIICEDGRNICLPKQEIEFKIGPEEIVIKGSFVLQRSEDRIHRKYRG
jgi:RNase P/RNase MRP subunit p29